MAGDWDLYEDLINFWVPKDTRGFLLKWFSFLGLCPPSNFQCRTTFRKPVVLPSSGTRQYLIWWTN